MFKKISPTVVAIFILFFPLNFTHAEDLSTKLSGKILLQVEDKGQAWYVDPVTKQRAFLGRPNDAFKIMRELSLGISEDNYWKYKGVAPKNLSGRILLRVEANGEAYYVNPSDLKMHYLGRPADAFSVMRTLGQGISNANLASIIINNQYKEVDYSNQAATQSTTNTTQSTTNSIFCNGKYWNNCEIGYKTVCPTSGDPYCTKEYTSEQLNTASINRASILDTINKCLAIYNELDQMQDDDLKTVEENLNSLTYSNGALQESFRNISQLQKEGIIKNNSAVNSYINFLENWKTSTLTSPLESFVSVDLTKYTKSYTDAQESKRIYLEFQAQYEDSERQYLSVLNS